MQKSIGIAIVTGGVVLVGLVLTLVLVPDVPRKVTVGPEGFEIEYTPQQQAQLVQYSPQQLDLLQKVDELKEKQPGEQPAIELQRLSGIVGTWDYEGTTLNVPIYGEVSFNDDGIFVIRNYSMGTIMTGEYYLDMQTGIITLVSPNNVSDYLVTDLQTNSFNMSNPLLAEYYYLDRV